MSLFGYQTVASVTRTPLAPLELVTSTAFTLPNLASLSQKIPTTTRPATVTGATSPFATNRVVTGTALNYAKVQPYISGSGVSFTFSVIGWNVSAAGLWIPQLLATCSSTASTTASIITPSGSPTVYPAQAISKSVGDAKIYIGNATVNGGFVIVDMCGAELIEVVMTCETASTTGYVAIGFL